ncbi:hypothetical protein PR003_g15556 [Phytophthora rubi]|uniref:Fatty acid desaturase domain-containing protein n=1 Tax=Phytophthora rubi TaxID=129364 RepID=A0A6A3ML55_9STRA|nr:hypothetical protein PR002_g8631 [Phytophthora rubi]KAE9037379.1 hypothetical protein PR001_g8402 [Phytophthora rubi]KAE9329444.1 hypothetical protein PR003_g15556 [Phytophthora rubi]
MAILYPEADSAAKLATASEAKQRHLAEDGYKHVEGPPAPLALELSQLLLRIAIPKHCFEWSFVTSTNYMIKNVLTCAALFYAATFIDRTGAAAYLLRPVSWFFQGSYPQASGSSRTSAATRPTALASWRISHRKHHSNTGSCGNDEVFVLVTRSVLASFWNETLEDSPLYQLYRIASMLGVGWMPGNLFFNATGPT